MGSIMLDLSDLCGPIYIYIGFINSVSIIFQRVEYQSWVVIHYIII